MQYEKTVPSTPTGQRQLHCADFCGRGHEDIGQQTFRNPSNTCLAILNVPLDISPGASAHRIGAQRPAPCSPSVSTHLYGKAWSNPVGRSA